MASQVFASLVLIMLFATASATTPTVSNQRAEDVHLLFPRGESCPDIEGNSDFYGLGIRVGIYLQWFSSWFSNTVNPDVAAVNHDTNTIFLLAISVATVVAFSQGSLQPAERYILLLLSSGFFFTVLSLFGLRLHFLQPSGVSKFCQVVAEKRDEREAHHTNHSLPNSRTQSHFRFGSTGQHTPRLWNFFRRIKHPALSWAGVMNRSVIATLLAVLNLWTWWAYPYQLPSDGVVLCTPSIYFFGPRDLSDALMKLFRVAAIAILVPTGAIAMVLIWFTGQLWLLIRDWILRHCTVILVEKFRTGAWDDLGERWKVFIGLIITTVFPLSGLNPSMLFYGLLQLLWVYRNNHINGFWNIRAEDLPAFGDVLKGIMSLWSRKIEIKARPEGAGQPDDQSSEARTGTPIAHSCLSAAMHVFNLVTITVFILFIERTIVVAGVNGVHTVSTTGQLIPLIIGIVSIVTATRDPILFWLRKKNPTWSKYRLEFDPHWVGSNLCVINNNGDEVVELSNVPAGPVTLHEG